MPTNSNVYVSDSGGAYVATTNGVNVGAGHTITVKLVNPAGVEAWQLTATGTDETSSLPTISVSGTGNNLRTFTAGSAGTTTIFQSQTTDGNGNQISVTFGIYVLTSGSSRVIAATERYEGNSTYGWITSLNPTIRAAGTFTLWTYQSTITANTSLSRLLYQIQPINTTGGAFTLTLPTSPTAGDRVDIPDVGATSAATGIGGANALTVSGTANNVQNAHNMTVTSVSYTFGAASGDLGGSTLSLMYTGTFWKVVN